MYQKMLQANGGGNKIKIVLAGCNITADGTTATLSYKFPRDGVYLAINYVALGSNLTNTNCTFTTDTISGATILSEFTKQERQKVHAYLIRGTKDSTLTMKAKNNVASYVSQGCLLFAIDEDNINNVVLDGYADKKTDSSSVNNNLEISKNNYGIMILGCNYNAAAVTVQAEAIGENYYNSTYIVGRWAKITCGNSIENETLSTKATGQNPYLIIMDIKIS